MSQQTGSNLTDQVTIITGASGGIGLACAKRLLNQHHKVVLVDINPEKLASAVEELVTICLLYTSPSPRDGLLSRMPSSA